MTASTCNRAISPSRHSWPQAGLLLALGLWSWLPLAAQEKPAAPQAAQEKLPAEAAKPPAEPAKPPIVVKLVSDFASGKLVSDLEEIQEITTTVFDSSGSREQLLGERCVLWVRNAHVDGKFFFEHYYQGKYVGRNARLEIEAGQLGPGEHVIQPGDHKFTLSEQGQLASQDPSIRIDGNNVLLQLHQVTIQAVDAAKTGPNEFRLVSSDLGLLSMDSALKIDPAQLPNPAVTFDPQSPSEKSHPVPPLTNVLSHQKAFYPLSVWLPSNQVGQGYVLYPSWQAFHLRPDGQVDLDAPKAPRVPGIAAHAATIAIPHRTFSGQIKSVTGLNAGVGSVALAKTMKFGATLAPSKFVGSHQAPPEDFFLLVDNDFTKHPHKFFLADNSAADKEAVRLLALEWADPVYPRGSAALVRLRLLETPGKGLAKPQARMSYSKYRPSNPVWRDWRPVKVLGWLNGRNTGDLRFQVPDADLGYVVFRVEVTAAEDAQHTPLAGEIAGCIIDANQTGSASFVSNRGRTAFVAGEDLDLQLVLRSEKDRPAGERTIVLTHPDGQEDTLPFADPGHAWFAQSVRLPASHTVNLSPGQYQLSVRGLPEQIASLPFTCELVGRQKPSLFHVVKPSKYTQAMNELETSHLQGKPIDLDRAMRTFAELGYTRLDLMSYMTNHHLRAFTWREELSVGDARLPPPEGVYTPTPREQIMNACVRNQLQYADVWLSYGDFHLPRYIDSYIHASERWMAREMQAMRHSPALDGMILYDEMYQSAAVGFVPGHQKYFSTVRARLAEEQLGESPAKIEQALNRYLQRPASQRDPKVLQKFLTYQDWQQHSWADFVNRVVRVGKALDPLARFGTYTRTWMIPGANDDIYHGYPPDLFKSLDIIAHIHYADNSTSWVSIPQMAQILRTGHDKTLYVNMPLTHEARTEWDGQYQRHMAFAQLAQGANGVAQWGLPHTFEDGPNPGTAIARETTRRLNADILRPLGEIIDRTQNGYRKIGIVSTKNQHALSQFKQLPVANQTEAIWIACWRLGYPAVFLREDTLQEPLDDFAVLFVPGVRFEGELDESVVKRLSDAIAAGKKVVVESDSVLDLPGITKLSDWMLNNYFVGDSYFPTWEDDELNKVYEKSQPTVDYLGPKLKQWEVEPAATGPFKVGPSWRDGGDIDYLVMANFEDPDYGHTVRQQMAKPVLMPLTVAAHHGRVAYDLLTQKELVVQKSTEAGREATALTLDMRTMPGAFVAFLPERIGKLQVRHAVSTDPDRLRLTATLAGQSGQSLDGVFPVEITLQDDRQSRTFYRVLGRDLTVELDLPRSRQPGKHRVTVREAISGQTVALEIPRSVPAKGVLELPGSDVPLVPHPGEVRGFLSQAKSVLILPSKSIPGLPELAKDLVRRLKAKGIEARVGDEDQAYHYPAGDPKAEDPLGDGFHSWHGKQEVIGPATIVAEHVILLGGRHSLFLLDALSDQGYLSVPPLGSPGLAMCPSIQVAAKGLHYDYDTLCLIANEAAGMQRNIEALFGELAEAPSSPAPKYGADQTLESANPTEVATASSGLGTNELVKDLQFDAAGNLYAITWGHGKNLYSLQPDGALRFSRFLPEMGANRLSVYDDRLYAYTSAGARLYRLSLDNQPVAQARLNMDPGTTLGCDQYSLSTVDFTYLPARKRLLHNMGDRMRILDDQFEIVAEWRGEEYFDKDVADKILRRQLHGYAVSPDGQKIAQLESSSYFTKWAYMDQEVFDTHLVIRDLDGKLLCEHKNLANGLAVKVRLTWPADAPGPVAYLPGATPGTPDRRWAFAADLQVLSDAQYDQGAYVLEGERRLLRDGRSLVYYDGVDHERCRLAPLEIMPTVVQLSPDGKWIAALDEYGRLSLFSTQDGSLRSQFDVPELGQVLRFTPDSQRLVLGGYRGGVHSFDFDGKSLWQTRLGEFNEILGQQLPLYDPSFPDFTEKLWPVGRDKPGELDKLVRLGASRLINGDAETSDGWQGAAVAYAAPGHDSSRSLKVGEELVGQEVTGFLGTHATWVLEFFYRSTDDAGHAELLAGLMTESDQPDSVAAHFQADGTWRFERVVIKNGGNCRKLAVGFSAQGGEVLVDQVQLRQIRFPSVNHLLYEPLSHLQPVVLDNPLFSQKYDPVGNLREQAPNRVMVPPLATGPLNLVESTYLQNGRLNDITSHWFIEPFDRMSPHLPLSLGLKEPRWVSMVALYFNEYDPANVTPHFDIYAVDPETNKDKLVASVRHNGQRFRLVKFPPIKTPLVKVDLVNSIGRLRTLTEVELYGPLSGREGTPGFTDPDGQNTYMGDFSRVDKRTKTLAEKYLPPIIKRGGNEEEVNWFAPLAEILASEDRFHVARTFGKNTAYTLADPMKELYWGRAGGLGYTPYGAIYGGLLLRCGNDGKLYCINPETGTELWSVALGQRLFGCPVAIGEDIFVVGDPGKLYQLDVASGTIMKEVAISGAVFGSLATDGQHLFFITDEGFLHCLRVADLASEWKIAVAPFSDSTPAVDQGVVYVADQQGQAMAVDVQTGKPRWTAALDDEFCRCPVVGPDKVIFGCRGGTLAVLDRGTGKTVWSKRVESRFQYEPVSLGDQALFFRNGAAMLAQLADGAESPWQPAGPPVAGAAPGPPFILPQDPIVPISYYKGRLFFIERPGEAGHNILQINAPWHVTGGSFTVLAPVPPPLPPEEKK